MPSPLLLPVGNLMLLFFLPHSLWRTTCYGNTSARCRRCFYPRPLHGGRQGNFSLSALPDRFLSTHALLTEGDTPWPRRTSDRRHFYPHPPHGGRPGNDALKYVAMKFLPTPSTRRATRTPAAYPDGRSKFLPTPSTRRATLQPRH